MDNAAQGLKHRRIFSAVNLLLRDQLRRFIEWVVVPFHRDWERAGQVPRDLWRKAGAQGFLCTMLPEEFGGGGGDFGHAAVVIEELARVNASGVAFQLHSDIVVPYILAYARAEQQRAWLPKMAAGEVIGAIAMTEP
ncbi:MAG: acyl-CoA dehydrogenase family protein, partial [Alphaproteobacteria bacterium]